MNKLPAVIVLLALLCVEAFGQADQVKRRARDLSRQNDVRQGVPPPVQAPAKPAQSLPPRVAATNSAPSVATLQARNVAKIEKDLAAVKTGSATSEGQRQQLITDIAASARGAKPGSGLVKTFVESLVATLPDGNLTAEHQSRLAQDIEAVVNSKAFSAEQYSAILADAQATLVVAGIKRQSAAVPVKNLKAIGDEVRR